MPFAEALRAAMTVKGMTPSDVARELWGSGRDSRGYNVAKNRDRMGHYMNGVSYPGVENMTKLAHILEMPIEELALKPKDATAPGAHMEVRLNPRSRSSDPLISAVPDQPTKLRLQLDQIVDWRTALKILEMVKEAEEANPPSRSGDLISRDDQQAA